MWTLNYFNSLSHRLPLHVYEAHEVHEERCTESACVRACVFVCARAGVRENLCVFVCMRGTAMDRLTDGGSGDTTNLFRCQTTGMKAPCQPRLWELEQKSYYWLVRNQTQTCTTNYHAHIKCASYKKRLQKITFWFRCSFAEGAFIIAKKQ